MLLKTSFYILRMTKLKRLTIAWMALNFVSLLYIRISQLHDFWRGTFTIVLTRYLRFLTTKVFHSLRAWIMGNGKHSRETTGLQQDQMMSSWPWLSICGEFKHNGILDFIKSWFQLSNYTNQTISKLWLFSFLTTYLLLSPAARFAKNRHFWTT